MPSHGREIPIELRAAVATCRILYLEKFEEIERKTGVNYKTAAEIMRRAIGRAGSEDFYEVLACLGDLNRPGQDTRVVDGTQLSATIRNAILDNPTLKPKETVLEKENIDFPGGKKRPTRSMIERIQHEHTHQVGDEEIGEIVRGIQPTKPMLTEKGKAHRKRFCGWAIGRINEGDIFIFSDEHYNEIGRNPHKKPKISRPKGSDPYNLATMAPHIQFTIMQWGSMTSKAVMGPQFLWEAETEAEKNAHKEELGGENKQAKNFVEKQRANALIPGTAEYQNLEAINEGIQAYNNQLKA